MAEIDDFLKGLTREQKIALLEQLRPVLQQEAQRKNLEAARREAQQQMMSERGFLDNLKAGLGKSGFDLARGVGQLTGLVSREDVDETNRLDAPLMETGGGVTGKVLGDIGTTFLPMGAMKAASFLPGAVGRAAAAAPAASTVVGGMGLGGATGFIQPVGTNDSRTVNTGLGAFMGGAIPAAVTMGKTAKAALWDTWTQSGRDTAWLQILFKDKTPLQQDELARKLLAAKEVVPGSLPTAAEATLDPTIAAVMKAAQNEPGPMKDAIVQRLRDQAAARQGFLSQFAKDPADVQAIQQAASREFETVKQLMKGVDVEVPTSRTISLIDRMLASGLSQDDKLASTLGNVRRKLIVEYPADERIRDAAKFVQEALSPKGAMRLSANDYNELLEVRRVLIGGARAGSADAEAALEVLKAADIRGANGQKVMKQLLGVLDAGDFMHETRPDQLVGLYRWINAERKNLKVNGADIQTLKALDAVKRSLGNALDKATKDALPPGQSFKDTTKRYAEAMSEKEKLEILQYIQNRASGKPMASVDAAGNITEGAAPLFPAKFDALTRGPNQAATVRAATGKARPGDFARELDPAQLDAVSRLRADLLRSDAAEAAGAVKGSPTAQNLITSHFINQALTGGLGNGPLSNAFGVGLNRFLTQTPVIGPSINALTSAADRGMKQHGAEMLMDPSRLGAVLAARAAAQQGRMAQLSPVVQRYLPGMMVGGGFGMFAPRYPNEEDLP